MNEFGNKTWHNYSFIHWEQTSTSVAIGHNLENSDWQPGW